MISHSKKEEKAICAFFLGFLLFRVSPSFSSFLGISQQEVSAIFYDNCVYLCDFGRYLASAHGFTSSFAIMGGVKTHSTGHKDLSSCRAGQIRSNREPSLSVPPVSLSV